MILVETDFSTPHRVAEKWGITTRTIRGYRTRLNEDTKLFDLYNAKRTECAKNWIEDTTAAIKAGALRLQDLFTTGKKDDSFLITAISGGIKTLGELNISYSVLKDDEPTTDQ